MIDGSDAARALAAMRKPRTITCPACGSEAVVRHGRARFCARDACRKRRDAQRKRERRAARRPA